MPPPRDVGPASPQTVVREATVARYVHEAVNEERARRRLPRRRESPLLARVAERDSADMARRGFLDHVTPDGDTPVDRAVCGDVTCGPRHRPSVCENLAQSRLCSRRTHVRDEQDVRTRHVWRSERGIARESVADWIWSADTVGTCSRGRCSVRALASRSTSRGGSA